MPSRVAGPLTPEIDPNWASMSTIPRAKLARIAPILRLTM